MIMSNVNVVPPGVPFDDGFFRPAVAHKQN